MVMEKIVGRNASYYLNDEKSAQVIAEKMAKTLVKIHKTYPNCIQDSNILQQQYELKQRGLLEIMFFINKRCPNFLGFSPPRQRRFIAAVKRLKYIEPKKFRPTLVHLDYEPNHVIVSNGRCIVVDWGEASIGDPAYDVAWTYHKLRLGRAKAKVDLGEYFVKSYEKYNGQRLVNLQFCKDTVAIEMAKWCGLSPFYGNRFRNYAKFVALFFGDVVGELARAMYVYRLRGLMTGHHTSIWSNIEYIQNYATRYLQRDRYGAPN